MPQVFTIYNCGTGYNRQNLDETVANLAQRDAGEEDQDWMINDGPGSRPHRVSRSAPAIDQRLAAQARTPGTGPLAVILGVAKGDGWERNVDRTMTLLNAMPNLPSIVNMVGWSRGAITCFMIAHALIRNRRTSGIGVNIFAFDPVPGPGNFDDPDKVTLPANVRAYKVVVQEDERNKIFKPVLINPNPAVWVGRITRFYYMPGGHGTGVFRTKSEVGLIAAYLAHDFLQQRGTRLKNPIHLTGRDLCELYAKIRIDIAQYHRMGGVKYLLRQRREVANRFQDTGYFINDHHATEFYHTFPQISKALDRGVSPANQTGFVNALNMLRATAPTTYISLQKTGIVE